MVSKRNEDLCSHRVEVNMEKRSNSYKKEVKCTVLLDNSGTERCIFVDEDLEKMNEQVL